MLKSQDIVVALGVVVATAVILFGTSSLPGNSSGGVRSDSTAIRPVSPAPLPEDEPEASPPQLRADSLPIVRVALPVASSR